MILRVVTDVLTMAGKPRASGDDPIGLRGRRNAPL